VSELCGVEFVHGVTQLCDVVYVICGWSSAIRRYDATTYQQLTDINVKDLRSPWDIVACELTSELYVADSEECVWRVSSDGVDIQRWLPKSPSDTFKPYALSVTSSRLLVTSRIDRQLIQFDAAGGDELRRVGLPDYMRPLHAIESRTGTFIVSNGNRQLDQYQICEVSTEGQVLHQFSSSHFWPIRIAVDSQGNILVADYDKRRILLLDAQLALRRVIIDAHQLNYRRPERLCYLEQSGQLLVALKDTVAVFDVLQR